MWGGMQNLVQKTCAYCSGSGRNFTNDCSACRGQGSIMVSNNAQKCNRCSGSGKQFTKMCHICNGTGWMAMPLNNTQVIVGQNIGYGQNMGYGQNITTGFVQSAQTNCRLCSGSGRRFTSDCPGCNGRGVVMVVQPSTKCAQCSGSGTHFTSICNSCGGCGYANRIV